MASDNTIKVDVLIFGGGIAGLWLLDELRRRGYCALLLENRALGHGQTVASQGIIHGGVKYMFDGKFKPSVASIAEMPPIWRDCLAGQREPDLSATIVRSPCCMVWGTGGFKSWLFLTGSKLFLRAAPEKVDRSQWPAALANLKGKVLRVPEQVIDPASLTANFAARNAGRILHLDGGRMPEFGRSPDWRVVAVRVFTRSSGSATKPLIFSPATVVFSAGEGNAALRRGAGLSTELMQRRPLHGLIVRGNLPPLWGHCVEGAKPRVTITSAQDSVGWNVWLVGGTLSERGVDMSPSELISFAKAELPACVPGLDLRGAQMATYRVDRAEAANAAGQRPDDVQVLADANVLTAWPTKLALAPRLADRILAMLPPPSGTALPAEVADVPAPPVAALPWEEELVTWSAAS